MTGPRPSVAGVYDYLLGGTDHSPADQAVGDQIMAALPEAAVGVRAQRDVLRRAVRHLAAEAGVAQFADLGSGLPTADNVHQIAQRHHPGAPGLYVDHDPAVVAKSQQRLAADENTLALSVDLRDPAAVLADPAVAAHLDWTQPVALLMCGILHYVPDDDHPADLTATWYQALAPGSYVFIHHL